MRFKKLTIQNFMSVGPPQEVMLDKQGIVGIIAPNGSGKSTIIEALVWCIWGRTIRDLKSDEVINNKTEEDCMVALEIEDGSFDYEICRYRNLQDVKKKNDVIVKLNGVDATQGVVADTQTLIDEIVGISFDTFAQSVLLTANTQSFCTLKDSEQKEVLEDILNIDLLRKAQAEAKKRLQSAEAALSAHLARLDPIADHVEAVEDDLVLLNTKSATWEREKNLRLERIQNSLRETKKSLEIAKDAQETYDTLMVDVDDLQQKIYKVENELTHKQREVLAVEAKIADNLRKIRQKRVEQQTVIRMTKDSISRLATLAGTVCETCSQEIDPDTAEQQMDKLSEIIDDAEGLLIKLDNLEEKLIRTGEDEKTPILDSMGPLRDKIKAYKNKIALIEDDAEEWHKKAASEAAFKQRLADLETSEKDHEKEENPFIDLIAKGKEEIEAKKKEVRNLKGKVKALELELKGLRFWDKGFGNQGLKSYLMDNVVPFLNERAQKYADIMSDGSLQIRFSTQTRLKGGGLREKFNVSVVNSNGSEVYKGNSSGERRRSDVAIGWALADLAATRASKPIRFRGLDEPFENLDEEGIDAVFKLLQHAAKEYETIFCITHNGALKTRFTKELSVTKAGKFTRIEQ